MSKSIHQNQQRFTTEDVQRPSLPDTSISPPTVPARTCRPLPEGVDTLAPLTRQQRLSQIVLDCDPALPSPDCALYGRPSNRKSVPERKSWLTFRHADSFPIAASFQPASTSATTRPPSGRSEDRPAAAKRKFR